MAAETLNVCMFGGRVVADAEVRYNADGRATVRFRFVTDNRRRNESGEWTDDPFFMRIVCFGRIADRYVERPLLKGNRVTVVGRMETPKKWQTERSDGIDVTVLADQVARYDFGERETYVETDDAEPEYAAEEPAPQPQRQAAPQQRQAAPQQRQAPPAQRSGNGQQARPAPQRRNNDLPDAADLEDLPF